MGINGLWDFIKKKRDIEQIEIPNGKFRGRKIPVDALGYMAKYRWSFCDRFSKGINYMEDEFDNESVDKDWYNSVIKFIIDFMRDFSAVPVFVFDGKDKKLKEKTLKKRADDRKKGKKLIKELREQDKLTPTEINKLRRLIAGQNLLNPQSVQRFKELIIGLGIPCVTVAGDGERFCSRWCAEEKLPGVISSDGDCFAHGAPALLTTKEERNTKDGGKTFVYMAYALDDILDNFRMTQDEFVEFCIMCGTDYNENIQGIACVKSFDALKDYGCIDKLPKKKYDISILNHEEVKKEFAPVDSKSLILSGSLDITIDDELLSETLANYKLGMKEKAFLKARDNYLEAAERIEARRKERQNKSTP